MEFSLLFMAWLILCIGTRLSILWFERSYRSHFGKIIPKWDELGKRKGTFGPTIQDDVINHTLVCIHHFIAGLLMVSGNSTLFVFGLLAEISFEGSDVIAMILRQFPHHGKFDPAIIRLMLAHHSTGLLCGFPLLINDVHLKTDSIAKICGIFVLGGAISLAGTLFSQTRDIKTEKLQIFVANLIQYSFFSISRIFYSPPIIYDFLIFVKENLDWRVYYLFLFGAACMTFFTLKYTYINSIKLLNLLQEVYASHVETKIILEHEKKSESVLNEKDESNAAIKSISKSFQARPVSHILRHKSTSVSMRDGEEVASNIKQRRAT